MQNRIMKKIKHTLIAAGIMASSLFLMTGCGSTASDTSDDVIEIRVAFNQNEQHPQYLAMKQLGEKFEEATNGKYHMTIYANGVLGEQGSVAEFVRTGALQMAVVPCSVPEAYNSDFAIVGAPYLYDGIDHMERAVTSGVYDDLFATASQYNFEVLTVYTAGERNIYSNKPINSADDINGMIVRVNDSATYFEMISLLGGSGTAMAQSDVYTALQQGVIDAGENSELVFNDFKHYEVADYYSYTKHIVHPDVVIASSDFMNSMTDEEREIFDELVLESTEYEFETFKEKIEQAKEEIAAQGTQFCYPDVDELRAKCEPLLDKIANRSDITRQVYEDIAALREENE